MAFATLNDLVKAYESKGDYTALNYRYDSTHTASGAYQITDTTWRRFASAIGVDLSQYPSAYKAPASVQDSVFAKMVSTNGLSDYTCPGCNPKLTSYLASNPDAAGLPIGGGDGTVFAPGVNAGTSNPTGTAPGMDANGNPCTAIQNALGLGGCGNASRTAADGSKIGSSNGTVQGFFSWFSLSRLSLAVLAILFIGGAIMLLAIRSGISIETARA